MKQAQRTYALNNLKRTKIGENEYRVLSDDENDDNELVEDIVALLMFEPTRRSFLLAMPDGDEEHWAALADLIKERAATDGRLALELTYAAGAWKRDGKPTGYKGTMVVASRFRLPQKCEQGWHKYRCTPNSRNLFCTRCAILQPIEQ